MKKKRGNKNRKENVSSETSPQIGTTKNKMHSQIQKQKKIALPPPINVVGIKNYEGMLNLLKSASVQTFTVK